MTRIMTFGAFDLLHYGHMRLLERIASRGDVLSVGLASDALIASNRKPLPFYSYEIRREMLLHTRYVDEVVLHDGPPDGRGKVKLIEAKITAVLDNDIDEVIMGSDWIGEYEFLKPYCRVSYLERTPLISTRMIRTRLRNPPTS